MRQVFRLTGLGKRDHGNRLLLGHASAMQLDPLDFVERFGGEVALAAMGTTDHRDILDDQQPGAFAVAACDVAYPGRLMSTTITKPSRLLSIDSDEDELSRLAELGDYGRVTGAKDLAVKHSVLRRGVSNTPTLQPAYHQDRRSFQTIVLRRTREFRGMWQGRAGCLFVFAREPGPCHRSRSHTKVLVNAR